MSATKKANASRPRRLVLGTFLAIATPAASSWDLEFASRTKTGTYASPLPPRHRVTGAADVGVLLMQSMPRLYQGVRRNSFGCSESAVAMGNNILVGTSSWTDKTLIESGKFYPPSATTP